MKFVAKLVVFLNPSNPGIRIAIAPRIILWVTLAICFNESGITVATVPVGGYSIPININIKAEPSTPYIILVTILTIAFTVIKRKTTRK